MTSERRTLVVVDGNSLFWAFKQLTGNRTLNASEKLDYRVLKQYLDENVPNIEEVLYYRGYSEGAQSFYRMLESAGYTLKVQYPETIDATKALVDRLLELENEKDYDLFFVGGSVGFSKRVRSKRVRENQRSIGQILVDLSQDRKVSVAYFDLEVMKGYHRKDDNLGYLSTSSIEFHDLVRDVGVMPTDTYDLRATDQVELQGNAKPGPRDPAIVLVDGENIHFTLLNMLKKSAGNGCNGYQMTPEDQVQWNLVRDWVRNQYQEPVPVDVLFFVQSRDTTIPFMTAMDEEYPWVKLARLQPEPDPDNPAKMRSVVDDAINFTIKQLTDTWGSESPLEQTRWDGDLYVVSHDSDFIDAMFALDDVRYRNNGSGRVAIMGFQEHLNGVYHRSPFVGKIDLEYDVKAFSYEIPGRPQVFRVDDYSAEEFLPNIIRRKPA